MFDRTRETSVVSLRLGAPYVGDLFACAAYVQWLSISSEPKINSLPGPLRRYEMFHVKQVTATHLVTNNTDSDATRFYVQATH